MVQIHMGQRSSSLPAEDLADLNLLESIREHAYWQGPCELREDQGVLLLAGATSFPGAYRNSVARVDRAVAAADVLAIARDFFQERYRGFTVWVRTEHDQDLEALVQSEGLDRRADGPCMLIESPPPLLAPPPGVEVVQFADEQHVRDAIDVNSRAYEALGLPAEETYTTFREPKRLLSDRVVGFVAYLEGRPVSTALTLLSGDGAGIYWVGTAKDRERSGLGGLCTRYATQAAFSRGARVVMLQASPFGEPVYRRLGYREYERARWYSQPSRAAAEGA